MTTRRSPVDFLTSTRGLFFTGLAFGVIFALTFGFILHQRSEAAKESAAADAALGFSPDLLDRIRPVSAEDHVLGKGKVTMIEYGDYECPFCRSFHPTLKRLMEKNEGRLRWVFRHLPVREAHPEAEGLASAAECAADQGKFWEITDAIYADEAPKVAKASDYAKSAGIEDIKSFEACLSSNLYFDVIARDANEAMDIGAEGTPFTVLMGDNGLRQALPGDVPEEALQSIIDTLLAQ
jgi:protein-disulfide isomerase